MRATAQPIEGNKVKLSVELDVEEVDKAVDTAFRKMAREVRVPGFRPGKVPRRLLEARVGPAMLRQEALRESLPDFYARAVRDTDVDPIAAPDIDITAGEESGPVVFDATVEVRPVVSVAGYQGLAVTLSGLDVDDAEVEAQIDRLRSQQAELATVARPAQDGDHVTIDLGATRQGQAVDGLTSDDFVYEVGSGTIVAAMDEQLRGKRPGDILELDAGPEDSELRFRVLVKEVKEKILPELTDAWAADASELETVEELRANLRDRLALMKRAQAQRQLGDRAVDALVALVDTDAPEALVAAEMERRLHDLGHRLQAQGATLTQYLAATGQDQAEVLGDLREVATTGVKADLALRALAEAESLVVSDEELDDEVASLAERWGQPVSRVRDQLEDNGQMATVRSDLRKAKALGWLIEHVETVDDEGRTIERSALFPPPAEPLAAGDGAPASGDAAPASGEGPIGEPPTDQAAADEVPSESRIDQPVESPS